MNPSLWMLAGEIARKMSYDNADGSLERPFFFISEMQRLLLKKKTRQVDPGKGFSTAQLCCTSLY